MAFRPQSNHAGLDSNSSIANHFKKANLAGTKWSHVGTGRQGINSILDKDIINDHLKTKTRNMGKGFIRLKLQDGDADTPINIGGRLMYPDSDGSYVIIDSSVVNEMQKSEIEKREYLESVIEKASLSNAICSLVLGMKDESELYRQMLGPGAKGGVANMSDELVATDAMPETIECLDPTGQTYSRAIQKFKLVIKSAMPMLDNMTPQSTLNEE